MSETKKGKFAGKGKAILGTNKPSGIADFLDNQEDRESRKNEDAASRITGQPQSRTTEDASKNTLNKTARGEYRFPEELSEKIRQYAFDKRRNKTDVVIQALEEFFSREGY
jgi:hypothetical protein